MSTCIEIKIGDRIIEKDSGRIGILKDIKLVPNGVNSPELIAQLFVYIEGQDKMVCSTSGNWTFDDTQSYAEFYPSVHLNHLTDKILETREYYLQTNIGKSKYVVSYHDGVATHRDGSPFYGISIFKNKKKAEACMKELAKKGYKERGYA